MKLKNSKGYKESDKNVQIDELIKEIETYRPFSRQLLRELRKFYRISLTYTNNALDGNSLTEAETKMIIEDGLAIGGKTIKEHNEALGHNDAYSLLEKLSKHDTITESNILKLHRSLYYRISQKNAGKYRKDQIYIPGTDYLPPPYNDVPAKMQEFVDQIPEWSNTLHPLAFAAQLHERIVSIHPFIKGNGRIARLVMNLSLQQSGYPLIIIPPVLRDDYISTIQLADRGDLQPFFDFISNVAYESVKNHLRLLDHFNDAPAPRRPQPQRS
jgi:Fic family protein